MDQANCYLKLSLGAVSCAEREVHERNIPFLFSFLSSF